MGLRLLIVEDNYQMRQLIKSAVEGLTDVVYECDDGEAALAAYAAHRPDWVLMDIEMPRVDGITATKQIKAAFPEARVLIVTQYDDAAMSEAAREAGAAGYTLKDDLFAVRRVLGGGPIGH